MAKCCIPYNTDVLQYFIKRKNTTVLITCTHMNNAVEH